MSITKDENRKIRHLMAAIESCEGVNIPYNLALNISSVYSGLKHMIETETISDANGV
jgi:hypothetical protein